MILGTIRQVFLSQITFIHKEFLLMPSLKKTRKRYYRHEALMRYARVLGFGEIHEKIDRKTGLHAIIAIHTRH